MFVTKRQVSTELCLLFSPTLWENKTFIFNKQTYAEEKTFIFCIENNGFWVLCSIKQISCFVMLCNFFMARLKHLHILTEIFMFCENTQTNPHFLFKRKTKFSTNYSWRSTIPQNFLRSIEMFWLKNLHILGPKSISKCLNYFWRLEEGCLPPKLD